MKKINVSIVIPTYNRPEKLGRCLQSLCSQEFPCERIGVIVVDDGGVDGATSLTVRLKTPYALRYLKKPHAGQGAARNAGVRVAKGDLIIFLDDDIQASPQLVSEHVRSHQAESRLMVLGKVVPLPGTGILNERCCESLINRGQSHGDLLEFNAITANLSIAREYFEALGGFDERFTDYGWEDTEFGFRLVSRQGLRLVFNDKALAYHDKAITGPEIARNQFLVGRGLVRVMKMHPDLLSERYSNKFREETLTHLEHTGSFVPLTFRERDELIAELKALERVTGKKEAAEEDRRKLVACYDWLMCYTYREGLATARRELRADHSIFESGAHDPATGLAGIPLTLVSTDVAMSGYGRHAGNLRQELTRRGFIIFNDYLYPVRHEEVKNFSTFSRPREIGCGESIATISLSPPFDFRTGDSCGRSIGYTTWETTRLPAEWVKKANRMDEIWVVSAFNKKAFEESGVKVPIYVMPHGLDTSEFRPGSGEVPFEPYGDFCFLSVGSFYYYKGFDIIISAYLEEFSASEDVCLIIKTYRYFHSPPHEIRKKIGDIKEKVKKRKLPRMLILENAFHRSMPAIYGLADVLVSASRGEGFCLPILEAMACGVPVIANNFGGQSDYLCNSNSFLLEYKLTRVCKNDHPYHGTGMWAETSKDHLRHMMRYVYEHREEREKKAERARSDFLSRWTLRHAGELMEKRLLQIMSETSRAAVSIQ